MSIGYRVALGCAAASILGLAGIVSAAVEPAPRSLQELEQQFADPGTTYRINFLLRTNDDVKPEEIRWQVQQMKEKGCGGTFSYHEYMSNGAPRKFLSDWWWQVVDWTAQACAEAGLEYWAYDEQDWPSGSVGGQLLEKHPEFRWKYLREETHKVKGGSKLSITFRGDIFVSAVAYKSNGDKIDAASLIDLSDQVKDFHLEWQAPAGDWKVGIYTAMYGDWGWSNTPYADLMDRKACGTFVDWVYRGHFDRVRKIPGAKLFGYFTDEPSMTTASYPGGAPFHWYPSMPFSPDIAEAFKRNYGYDYRSRLPLLYHDAGPETVKMRCRFWETCARLYAENYFGQIYDFCDKNGLIASGHIHVEESLLAHLTLQGGNVLEQYRRMHIPGIDWIYPFGNELPATTPKYATSAAHLQGRDRTWCESFAACGWGLTFQEIRSMVNWEHVNGINMQIPICYKYSLRGPDRLKFYNPGISYQQPYWDHFRAFADYEARMCLLAAGGGHVAQVALFYPSVDMWAHCWDHDLLVQRTASYNEIANRIRAGGYDFDVLDDRAMLQDIQLSGDELRSPTESYRLLVLPQMDAMRREVAAKCLKFVKQGGRAVFNGGLPRASFEAGSEDVELQAIIKEMLGADCYEQVAANKPFLKDCGKGKAGFAPTPVDNIKTLWELETPDLLTAPRPFDVYSFHRRLPDGDLYLLFNRKDETRSFEITLAARGVPEQWNPIDASIHAVPAFQMTEKGTQIPLTFAPFETIVLVLRPEGKGLARPAAPASKVVKEIAMPGPFRFKTEETITRPHVSWNFSQVEDGWVAATQPAVPSELPAGDWTTLGLPHFSGLGHYETDVQIDAISEGARAVIDLGKVAVSAEVFVNDKSAGIAFFAPYQLDITRLVKPGRNHVRIVVANTLVNYYSQFKELKDAPLQTGGIKPEHKVSGLLGPVSLKMMKEDKGR